MYTIRMILFTAVVLSLASWLPASIAQKKYDPGASDTEIKIGQTMPYSGPVSSYGTIGRTQAAYFKKINDEGGIHGRRITFISLDDSFSPPKTVEMVRRLVERDEVLLVFSSVGTPTNSAVRKYLNDHKVPHLFIATGASKWNDPHGYPWTMGWLPSYRTEARIYARHILATKPDARIGVLYQNDDYGKDYLNGFREALGNKARLIVAEVSYEVTDPTVDSQIVQLKGAGANVFFDITTPRFAAQAIRKAYDIGWKPVHYLNNVSASVASVLEPVGLEKAVGLITSTYIKDPSDSQWQDDAAIKRFAAFMKQYYPEGNPIDPFNVYGYAVAQTLVHVLGQCGDDLTRANVMKQAASLKDFELDTLLPGIKINTSPTDFAPIETRQLARFDGKQWVRFGDVMGD